MTGVELSLLERSLEHGHECSALPVQEADGTWHGVALASDLEFLAVGARLLLTKEAA